MKNITLKFYINEVRFNKCEKYIIRLSIVCIYIQMFKNWKELYLIYYICHIEIQLKED